MFVANSQGMMGAPFASQEQQPLLPTNTPGARNVHLLQVIPTAFSVLATISYQYYTMMCMYDQTMQQNYAKHHKRRKNKCTTGMEAQCMHSEDPTLPAQASNKLRTLSMGVLRCMVTCCMYQLLWPGVLAAYGKHHTLIALGGCTVPSKMRWQHQLYKMQGQCYCALLIDAWGALLVHCSQLVHSYCSMHKSSAAGLIVLQNVRS